MTISTLRTKPSTLTCCEFEDVVRCRERGIGLPEREFILENCQGHLVPLGAYERGQSDEDFLVF